MPQPPLPALPGGPAGAWLEREAGHLLPVHYHHVVFTPPAALADLARRRPRLVYHLLFQAAGASTLALAADPKYLGAQVGLGAVLHTWGQTLTLHPHLQVLATGGGLSWNARGAVDEVPRWVSCRPGFFLPVRVLSRLFRGKYLAGLRPALAAGPWPVAPGLERPEQLAGWLAALAGQGWVV